MIKSYLPPFSGLYFLLCQISLVRFLRLGFTYEILCVLSIGGTMYISVSFIDSKYFFGVLYGILLICMFICVCMHAHVYNVCICEVYGSVPMCMYVCRYVCKSRFDRDY